ncbi:MAG: 16S rRNA (guanine(527)-N(7))-methyltransferase RsmG [Proteobacteria bacterium]|nr:16S rRNA (guanine(527)-N(7))-methyltransferase RsmG [Pseudomonadota bacterium]
MFGPEDFQKAANVSRETLEKFKIYAALLSKWQNKINLIGPATREDVWQRHFLDSAQLLPLVQKAKPAKGPLTWMDIGSGAGFPGLVLALLGEKVVLVEPSAKRAAFLRQVIRETGVNAEIIQEKIEEIRPFPVDIVTARALANIGQLLAWGTPFLKAGGEFWLLKGARAEEELTSARKNWIMSEELFPSRTGPAGTVVRLTEIGMAGPARKGKEE